MDNLFLNRMITPEADKTRGKGSLEKTGKYLLNISRLSALF
jgi:hypothetical protein